MSSVARQVTNTDPEDDGALPARLPSREWQLHVNLTRFP